MHRQPDTYELIPVKSIRELAMYIIRDAIESLPHLNSKSPFNRKVAIESYRFLSGNGLYSFWVHASGINPLWLKKNLEPILAEHEEKYFSSMS